MFWRLAGVVDPLVEAIAAFDRAVEDAVFIRERWVLLERPVEQRTQNGMSGVHPVRRALVEADDRVAKRAELVKRLSGSGQRGRPSGAASSPDRVPQVRLREVK